MRPETLLMAAIFGETSTGRSDDDYFDIIDGITLHDTLMNLLDSVAQSPRYAPKFSQRVKDLMLYRYGFKGERRTCQQVGEIFDITRERIRQQELMALRMLRHPTRSSLLKPYLKQQSPSGWRRFLPNGQEDC